MATRLEYPQSTHIMLWNTSLNLLCDLTFLIIITGSTNVKG